jgi:hypothetical protein
MNSKKSIITVLLLGTANSVFAFNCIGLRITGMDQIKEKPQPAVVLMISQTNSPVSYVDTEMLVLNALKNGKALECQNMNYEGLSRVNAKAVLADTDGNHSTVHMPPSCTKQYKMSQYFYIKGNYRADTKMLSISKCWARNKKY